LSEKIAILGGGVTGLSAAWKLAEAGVTVDVFETEPQPGGLGASVRAGPYTFDYGIHAFMVDGMTGEVAQRFYDLMGTDLPLLKKDAKIKFHGEYFQYPLDMFQILFKLPPRETVLCARDFLIAAVRNLFRAPRDVSAEDWIVNRFGRSLYEIFFEKYTEKVWGVHPSMLDASFTEHRIPKLSLWTTLRDTLLKICPFHSRMPKKDAQVVRRFYYPPDGVGVYAERVAEKIARHGGRIHLQSPVSRIGLEDNRVAWVEYADNGRRERIHCDIAISTISTRNLLRMMDPRPPQAVVDAAEELRFRALLYVFLIVDRVDVLHAQWIYFRTRTFNRVTELNRFSPKIVPPGKTVLCAEITCDVGDELWNAPPAKLAQRVARDLEEEGFIQRGEVSDHHVLRTAEGYTIYLLHYHEHLEKIREYIRSIPNLYVSGRQGMFKYIQMDHAMEMGYRLADSIIEGRGKDKSGEGNFY
jgi:protoporphyrinogen oxidase